MTWYEREFWIRQFAIDHVKISPAHPARCDSHKQLALGRSWSLYVAELQSLPRLIQTNRAHANQYLSYPAPALARVLSIYLGGRVRGRITKISVRTQIPVACLLSPAR